MQTLGLDQNGEPVSKLFSVFIDKTSKRTTAIIQLLSMDQQTLLKQVPNFKGVVGSSEMTRVLTLKKFGPARIRDLTKNF